MSEMMGVTIRVYYPPSWNVEGKPPWFIEWLEESVCDSPCDEYSDGSYQIIGLGNYGLGDDDIDAALDYLVGQHIPYLAWDEPKYEYGGSFAHFDGNEPWTGVSDAEGLPVLSAHNYRQIVAGETPYRDVEHYYATGSGEGLAGLIAEAVAALPAEPPSKEDS